MAWLALAGEPGPAQATATRAGQFASMIVEFAELDHELVIGL